MRIISASIVLTTTLLISLNCMAQCDGRYETELFSGFTKTTVQYSTVYEVRPGDGNYLKMDIYQPDGDTFPNRPVVLMAHGGTFVEGTREDDSTCVEICKMFAKRGYVTASIDYRLANSQTELLDSLNALNIAMRSVGDMKAAVRYFRQDAAIANTYRIDPNQIFVGGNSAGAVTAVHVAYVNDTAELPSYLKTIVAQNGGIDGNSGNPGYPSNVSGVINLAGGINKLQWIVADDVPIVSCHGDNDGTVPYGCDDVLYNFLDVVDLCGSGAMKDWCDQIGTEDSLLTFPGDGHVPWASNATKNNQMMAFVTSFITKHTICSSVGIGSIVSSENLFSVYPNPTTGNVQIQIKNVLENEVTVELYDATGKLAKLESFLSKNINLDLSDFPKGLYMLRVKAGNQTATKGINKL